MMKNVVRACLMAGTCWGGLGLSAATLTGDLYQWYRDDAVACGIRRVDEDGAKSLYWRNDFVEVDGVREPGAWGSDCYAWSVDVAPGETFTPEIVYGTATAGHIAYCKAYSDGEMYDLFARCEDWSSGNDRDLLDLWGRGVQSTRAWIVVQMKNVTSGDTYVLDLSQALAVGDDGRLSSESVSDYALRHDVGLTGTRKLSESVWFSVRIKETGEVYDGFNGRVWNVCDPFVQDGDALEAIEYYGGDSDLISAPGLYFVTPEMVSGGGRQPNGGGASGPMLPSSSWAKAREIAGVMAEDGVPVGLVRLKIGKANAKTGVAKISGSFIGHDGKKVALKALEKPLKVDHGKVACTLVGNGLANISVVVDGARVSARMDRAVWDGRMTAGGALASAAPALRICARKLLGVPGELTWLEPLESAGRGEPLLSAAGKWAFPKAASVKLGKDGKLSVDTLYGKTNLSGLKLSYNEKTGAFKGTMKAYAIVDRSGRVTPDFADARLVKYKVTVTGFVADGCGWGRASCKKPAIAPVPVVVE